MIVDPVAVRLIIQEQFPEVYQEEAENLIAFLQAYYAWMEENEVIQAQKLLLYRNIDTTLDEFIIFFKNKYLKNLPNLTRGDIRNFIKHSDDFYDVRGTEEGIKLLFNLLYDTQASVYRPGKDIIKPSDGEWYQPVYLEVSVSDRNRRFEGVEIQGASSGAKAYVETVVRKVKNGQYFDVFYISNVRGNFQTGEQVSDGPLIDAPIVIGSLNKIDIIDGAQNYNVGDTLQVISESGRQGVVRVSETYNGTGRVEFSLEDGGTGYTVNAHAIVSNTVLSTSNNVGQFLTFETVNQPLANVEFTLSNGSFQLGSNVFAYSSGTQVGAGKIVYINQIDANGSMIVASANNFSTADSIGTSSNTVLAFVSDADDVTAEAYVIGSTANTVGIFDIHNKFYANTRIFGVSSGASARIVQLSQGSNATFRVGSIKHEESITLYSETVSDFNIANTQYVDIKLDGSNSGTGDGGYGFPKNPTASNNTPISAMLDSETITIGSIASLTGINPGSNYNRDPFVAIVEPQIVPFERYSVNINLSNPVGTFIPNEVVTQTQTKSLLQINFNNITGNTSFDVGEVVTQGAATGIVYYKDSAVIRLEDVSGTFDTSSQIHGSVSNADADVTLVGPYQQTLKIRGLVTSYNVPILNVKMLSFNSFDIGEDIVGQTSEAFGTAFTVLPDFTSEVMGNNAIVTALVKNANGIVSSVEVIDSGFGYREDDIVELRGDNQFVISGRAVLERQGRGKGFWKSTRGMLDSDKYIQDGRYYQAFSYEIRTSMSFDYYSDLVKKLLHTAGTEVFGAVVKETEVEIPSIVAYSEITQTP